ncbi:gamma-glutamyltransferase [Dactylosporangium sucinum]|uniref:Gamma-glutamyltranspeptidase n=1 Tax=Dactylosporangium sucinum TaxID=1424081 RepID=A0A917WP32_9ACTN|nr:gamma-glutamyltransferase [Dactylosporangium sucinum]GGM18470.1 gamma-glutamyltranspeptidase [Dactylosporangium sucinum]
MVHGCYREISSQKTVVAGVAAGHPATAEIGLRVLEAGGSAADAAVAATLAGCVAESVLTGLAGGGFATYYEAATGTTTCLDFFCAVPGLDAGRAAAPMVPISIAFGGVPQRYEIGASSVGVPGVPAGVAALHRRWGRLPWQRVVAPAASLARSGTLLPHPHASTLASIAPAMLPGFGAEVYAPGGKLLEGGELLHHPGLDVALGILAEEGPAAFYTGSVGRLMVDEVRAGGGVLTLRDLAAYRVLSVPVVTAPLAGATVLARADLNDFVATVAALPADFAALPRVSRIVALADALRADGTQRVGDTTNISVVDPDGNACVVTLTLGIGSGVWLPGLGVHLNSMLGEGDLVLPGIGPGERMASCMCPAVVTSPAGLVMGIGSAGATRIRTALLQTLVNVLVDGDDMHTAIRRPRLHVVSQVVHLEAGFPPDALDALAAAGYAVRQWDRLDHYFGGVSAVGLAGAAGDPRRGGIGRLL